MKTEKVQQILIYIDFTNISNKCIEWGAFFAEKFEKNILLLHVINDNTKYLLKNDNIEDEVETKLKSLSSEISDKYGIKTDYYYEEGCDCTIINSTAESFDCFFNVIGVHGKNDPQFFSGFSAAKVIRKSRVPFFVIQPNTPSPDINKPLLLPVNVQKEIKETVGWVTFLAKNLTTGVEVFMPQSDDIRVKNNLSFSVNFLKKFNLRFNKVITSAKYFRFKSKALDYAHKSDCLLMVSLGTVKLSIFEHIFGDPAARVISNNKGMPVFIITPKKDLYVPCI